MFGIVTSNRQKIFEQAIGETGVFHWDGSSIREQLDSAARVHIRTLLIDIEAAPIDQLIMALHSFRRQRPNTRIVIIAYNAIPGDIRVARCVALGIYDILAIHVEDEDTVDKEQIISRIQEKLQAAPATYSDAAKWHIPFHEELPTDTPKKKGNPPVKEQVKEKIIIHERLIGTPVIGIVGAHAGAGTTYCCLQICQTLMEYGRTAYVELENTRGLNMEGKENPSLIDGIEVWKISSLTALPPGYNYIVLNAGYWSNRTEEAKSEMRRATKAFVTTGSSTWRYRDFSEQVESLLEVREDWNILLQAPSEHQTKEIKKDVAKLKWPIFPVPYQPEPFKVTGDSKLIFEEALQEYTPKKATHTSIFRRLFARA